MTQGSLLRRSTGPAALGSVISLAAQAAMALFLLGLFEPQAVGIFSVVAQIAFGWATLALAQSPVSLLANQHLPALPAARQAWRRSLDRWLWLAPAAAAAVWWASPVDSSGLASGSWVALLAWTAGIALVQLSWLLAQSLTLRLQAPLSIAAVRMLPPLLAAALAGFFAFGVNWRSSHALTTAAWIGYAAGALWLLPALRLQHASSPAITAAVSPGDARSERLKFIHTLSDVVVATAMAAHWTAVYGAEQAGYLLILLRVTGFVPALVSTAWAHVVLSRPDGQRPSSALAAMAGAISVATAGTGVALILQAGWLQPQWQGLKDYLWPVVLWQVAASVMAAVSHRPFQHGSAVRYTQQCLAMNAVQVLLLVLPSLLGWSMHSHLWVLAGFLCIALLLQALWAAQLRQTSSGDPI